VDKKRLLSYVVFSGTLLLGLLLYPAGASWLLLLLVAGILDWIYVRDEGYE